MVYGVYRLAACVHEIRREGFNVFTTMHQDEAGKKYARYHMSSRKAAA